VKALTADQLQSRKDKAVRFVRNVLQDDERADEIESESLDDYAARRKVPIINPTPTIRRNLIMAGASTTSTVPTKADLQNALDEIAQKADDALDPAASRKELAEALQEIYSLASGEDESDDDEEEDGDEDDDQQ
jgi:hypothetical protein